MPDEKPTGGPAPLYIDILEMEMSKGLPHWLDPIEKYKGNFDEKRRQRIIERSKEIQGEEE